MAMEEGDLSKSVAVVLILVRPSYENLLSLQAADMYLGHTKVDVGILE